MKSKSPRFERSHAVACARRRAATAIAASNLKLEALPEFPPLAITLTDVRLYNPLTNTSVSVQLLLLFPSDFSQVKSTDACGHGTGSELQVGVTAD
jgi:hypothetical protein